MLLVQSSGEEPKRGDIYEVPLEQVRDLLRCRDDEHLAKELLGMRKLEINWNRLDPEAEGYSVPVPDLMWKAAEGVLRFAFSPMFAATFLETGKGFQNIEWEVLVGFRSVYSAKLYEWLAMYRPGENRPAPPVLTTAELRELLGVTKDQYNGPVAGDLFRKVRTSIASVNEAQDGFVATYEIQGRGRSARHVFTLTRAPKQTRLAGTSPASRKMQSDDLAPLRAAVQAALEEAPADVADQVAGYLASDSPSAVRVAAAKLREAGVELPG